MKTYQITSPSGFNLGRFVARNVASALNKNAQASGYRTHAEMCKDNDVPADWTTDTAEHARNPVGMLVVEVKS